MIIGPNEYIFEGVELDHRRRYDCKAHFVRERFYMLVINFLDIECGFRMENGLQALHAKREQDLVVNTILSAL